MVEIAEGLFQCPDCGAGPNLYWALFTVDVDGDAVDAQCVTYKPELLSYVSSYMNWEIGDDGRRLPDSLTSELLGHIVDPDEMVEAPLPHIADPARKLVLKPGMFANPLGEKRYGQKAGQRGTSSGAPSLAGSSGRSRPRRRKAGN